MARLVRHEEMGPYRVDVEGAEKSVWICGCGLSSNKPYCDGSHKNTSDEAEDRLYLYEDDDDEKPRRTVTEVVTGGGASYD